MRTSSLLRRRGVALGFEPRDLAVDVALLDLGVADRVVGGGDLLGDGGEGGAPFGERTRLALLAEAGGRRLGKALGELAARGRSRDRAVERGALVAQRLDPPVDLRQVRRRRRPRRRASTAPMTRRAPPSPSTRSDDGSSVSGKSRSSSVESPAGRSSRIGADHRRAVRIDGDGVDLGAGFDLGGERLQAARRQ